MDTLLNELEHLTAEPGVRGFDSPQCLLGVEKAGVAFGELHSPRVPLEGEEGQSLLSTLSIQNVTRITLSQT